MAFTKGTASFTNGSKVVTGVSLTSGQLAYFASGTAVFVQSEGQLIEAIGLPKDGNGDVIPNQFLLRDDWTGPTGSYDFVAFDTIEGLRDAVQSARGFSEQLQSALASFSVAPHGDSSVKRTDDGRGKFTQSLENNDAVTLSEFDVNPVANKKVIRTKDGRIKASPSVEHDDALVMSQVGTNAGCVSGYTEEGLSSFGYGGNLQASSVDLNSYTNNRFMFFGGSAGNNPLGNAGLGVSIGGSGRYAQLLVGYSGYAEGRFAVRTYDGSSWAESLVYTNKSVLGAVSVSEGVPTGAIIEQDSNSDGFYTKYADGTMICINNMALNESFNAGSFYRTLTFPATFSRVDYCTSLSPQFQSTSDINKLSYFGFRNSGNSDRGLSSIVLNVAFSTGLSFSFRPAITVIGRWY